jgi:hypothetical protein
VNTEIVGGTPCHIIFFPLENKLNLVDDSGMALVSSGGRTIGTTGTLANSICSIDPLAATKLISGLTMTINIPVSFNRQTFSGQKNVYVNAFDNAGSLTHWVQGGVIAVQ